MSNKLQYKEIDSTEIMDIDVENRTVKAVWSRLNNVDLDNDIIVPEAFTKTIKERGPKGKNLIWSLVDHCASFKHALGKPSELYVEGDMLIAVTKIVDTHIGEDMIKFYNDGLVNQHSIGFSTIKSEWNKEGTVRTIKELMLYEGSAVLWGANPETPTLGMSKSFIPNDKISLNQRLDKLAKAWKSGTYTDETFSLLELEIKQIQQAIEELTTLPVKNTVEPAVNNDLLQAIQLFNQTLNS